MQHMAERLHGGSEVCQMASAGHFLVPSRSNHAALLASASPLQQAYMQQQLRPTLWPSSFFSCTFVTPASGVTTTLPFCTPIQHIAHSTSWRASTLESDKSAGTFHTCCCLHGKLQFSSVEFSTSPSPNPHSHTL